MITTTNVATGPRARALLLLISLGAVFGWSYVVHWIPAFDDLYLPAKFADYVGRYGFLKTTGILLSGMDLATQYRTYGLSRLLQFALWLASGTESFLYPLFIVISQLGTAILLQRLAREQAADEPTSLAIAVIWMISPFAANWSFHHYSYLILPFQVVIAACYVTGRIGGSRWRYPIAALLGIACALTGETQLLAAPIALLAIALASRDRVRLRLSLAVVAAMAIALAAHRLYWSVFIRDASHPQRWEINLGSGLREVLSRALVALDSVRGTPLLQLQEIFSSGYLWGAATAALVGFAYWFATRGMQRRASLADLNTIVTLLAISLASLAVYVAISALTGQLSWVMPRRYGYVPLTLLLIVCALALAFAFGFTRTGRPLALAFAVGSVAFFAGQLQFGAIPRARAADSALAARMKEALGPRADRANAAKGALYFVSTDIAYLRADANAATIGPKMDALSGLEVLQSPFGYYWTAQHYGVNMLGLRFAAMPKGAMSDGAIEVGGSPYPNDPGKVPADDVIVVANLGFEATDPLGKNVRIFPTFREFEPYFFGRSINRDVLALGTAAVDDFVIELGRKDRPAPLDLGVMPDKRFGDAVGPMSKDWILDYGLVAGQDAVLTHPNVPGSLGYYRTNRHGVFTYGVEFRDAGMVEVSMDIWEQWGRRAGERVFGLEVSWDGRTWANVGLIDPAAVNGAKPFAIVLTKSNPRVFQFRLTHVAGKDIPVIHGLRIRRL